MIQFDIKTGAPVREIDSDMQRPLFTDKPLPISVLDTEKQYYSFRDQEDNVPYWPDDSCEWIVKDKQIKVTAYSKENKQPKEFDDKSLVTEGYTTIEPLPDSTWQNNVWVVQLDLALQSKRDQISAWRSQQENDAAATVTAINTEWNADPTARGRIEQTLASTFVPPFWTDAHDNDVEIIRDDLVTIHDKIVEKGFAIHARQREMKKDIESMTDALEVQAYVIGWSE